jgi:DNA mismatch endonuclease (patch repair protein)
MRGNRRRDTQTELRIRRELHARGLRYRVDHPVRLPGFRLIRPDLAFTRPRLAIFVDGCFWHGCLDHGGLPQRNAEYWRMKISNNAERDRRQTDALRSGGWIVMRFWEHETPQAVADAVQNEYSRLLSRDVWQAARTEP